MTQPQHLAALCFVCALKNLTTQADRPLPGLHVDHEGCSCLSMLSLAPFPATIASERELALTHTHTHTHSTPAHSGSETERRGEAACCAAELPSHFSLPGTRPHAPNKGKHPYLQKSLRACRLVLS